MPSSAGMQVPVVCLKAGERMSGRLEPLLQEKLQTGHFPMETSTTYTVKYTYCTLLNIFVFE